MEADASLVHAEGSKRHTPLHLGVRNGHVAVCSFLMEHGANIEAQDMQVGTAHLQPMAVCDGWRGVRGFREAVGTLQSAM